VADGARDDRRAILGARPPGGQHAPHLIEGGELRSERFEKDGVGGDICSPASSTVTLPMRSMPANIAAA
jgi:hypothetical protein